MREHYYGAVASVVVAAGNGPGGLFDGVKPSWGPFSELGGTARTLIGVILAAVLVVCLATAAVGIGKQRFGSNSRNSMSAEEGKGLIVAGLVGTFLVGSLLTITQVVYGMAI
jgi:hypothetical protein